MFHPVKWSGGNAKEPPSVFRRYTELNLKRGLEEIELELPKTEPLYIVCSGPSLSDTWHELKPRPGTIWACNAAWDYLVKQGIRPDYGVCLAPEDGITGYFNGIEPCDKFLFASQVHPVLMDRALNAGAKIILWHTKHPAEWNMPARNGPLIFGGGTVGSRSLDLAWVMGYRDIHILGMDACLSPDGRLSVERPMYEDRSHLRTYMIGGRAFVALPSQARQVEDIAAILRPLTGMEVTFYGDGLMQWAMASSQNKQEN